jgi:inositol transport system ATP-binding protein
MEPGCVLEVRNLSKSFPGVKALEAVRLAVWPGTVHALLGENGAGKSTLMKTLAGIYSPDAGEILLDGKSVRIKNPHEAIRLGISMIHQDLLPFPDLTAAENVCMGQEPTRRMPCWIDKPAMNRRAQELLGRLGVAFPARRKMRELGVAEIQTVEIAKALVHNARIIIMDEPTSATSRREVDALFGMIRDLRRQGVAIIYVSHKMEEIFRIADAITVLRDGRYVATHDAADLDRDRLIALMVGRELLTAEAPPPAPLPGEVALEVRGLTPNAAGTRRVPSAGVSFQVRRGDILGIAGLMGAGRTELVSALFGLQPAASGEIRVDGRPVRIASPRDAIEHGIAMVSEDRKKFGLVPGMSVKENLTLAALRQCCRGPWIDRRLENRAADEQIRALAIRTRDRNQRVESLSGGTQQKIVVAKALLTRPAVLILDEPTRGIDIGAKTEIYAIIRGLAAAGTAVIMVSSELPEILALSHRILVMREGEVTAELDPRRTTQEEILRYAMPD